jgi:hypothetical protein
MIYLFLACEFLLNTPFGQVAFLDSLSEAPFRGDHIKKVLVDKAFLILSIEV